MPFPQKPAKYYFAEQLAGWASHGTIKTVLELGCGDAEIACNLLAAYPEITYTGIEPDHGCAERARRAVRPFPKTRIVQACAYGSVPACEPGLFDLVFSLSVLEHVKRIREFISFSLDQAKPGGMVVHLYDLGHALHPASWKERMQIYLCNSPFIAVMPEGKVARYLSLPYLESLFAGTADIERITFHNMRSMVDLFKQSGSEELMCAIVAWESNYSGAIANLKARERIFPTIGIWARKK